MTFLLQDLRYAIRSLRKSPGFAAAAIATLALGIGANAAIFALVDKALLRLLPVRAPRELVLLRATGPRQGHTWSDGEDGLSFSYPVYRDLRDHNRVFSGLVAMFPLSASVASRGETERASGELVSGNYFEVLGVPPALGRVFGPGDDVAPGGHPLAVLSHAYWTRRYGGDPSVLNSAIVVNGTTLTVVGVTRAGFTGVQPGRVADVFVPISMKAKMTPFWDGMDDPKDYWVQLIGRLKPGLSRETAQVGLAATYRPILESLLPRMENYDDTRRAEFLNGKIVLGEGGFGRTQLRTGVGKPLLSLMGMVALVLLIACSNLASLLAARGAARQREYGVRLAVGASRAQLLRQSLVECLLFSVLGLAAGMAVASWTLHALLSAFPEDADMRQIAAQIDPRVLAFSAILALVSGFLFGIGPAYRAARLDPVRTLRGSGRGDPAASRDLVRFRSTLVTAQVALTLVLLVGAGLFTRSLRNLGSVELGLKADGVIDFSVSPGENGYTAERTAGLARRLTESLSALPGVSSVSAAELPTLTNSESSTNAKTSADPPGARVSRRTFRNVVGPAYFSTLGIPLVEGREFHWKDDLAAPKVAILNETAAREYFPGRSALGERLSIGKSDALDIEIVGVVKDSKGSDVGEKPRAYAYTPYLQDTRLSELTFYVRSGAGVDRLAAPIRDAVKRLDSQLPVFELKTLPAQISESLLTQRLIVMFSGAFAALAALLAAIGIYGVLAVSVTQRRQEIGVRMALGADPSSVRRLVLGDVLRFLAIGGAIGLPAAWALGRIVESLLFGVKATDPPVFAAGAALMAVVALVAGYLPARRASRVDPLDALRSE